MSESDRILVQEVMQGAPTPRIEIRGTANKLKAILQTYGDEAESVGLPVLNSSTGKSAAFRKIDNYFPLIHTDRSIRKYAGKEIKAVRAQLNKIPPRYRGGGVQFARTAEIPGWERDPLRALPIYIRRTAKRLAVAEQFGTRDEIASAMLQRIAQEQGDDVARQASAMWTAFAAPATREFSGLLQPVRDMAAVGMLTTTALLQPAQLSNTIARVGFLKTFRGLAQIVKSPEARRWAEKTGATVSTIMNDISPDGKGIAPLWGKVIGLNVADRANRLASAIAYKLRAEEIVEAIQNGRLTKSMKFDAERLGINIDDIAKNGISEQELMRVAQRGSNETQFASRFIDLPEWRDNELGRTVLLFRSFALQQGRFMKSLVNDAKKGHWSPLLRFVAAAGPLGFGTGELIRKVRGDEAPDNPVWRTLENLSYTVSLGLFQDGIRAVLQGEDSALQFAAGPVISEAAGIAGDIGKSVSKSIEEGEFVFDPIQRRLIRRTARRAPFVGRELAEELSP